MPAISIIIPAYNEENYIGECLKSIQKHKTPAVSEIIVVDNGSTDRTADIASSYGVRVLTETKKGPNFARQCGLQAATGDVVAYIDADCRIPAGWCATIERTFDRDTETVCLTGPCRYTDASLPVRILIELYWIVMVWPAAVWTRALIVGGNFAVRRNALLSIGGFDTAIPFYGDDTNLARRLRVTGTMRFSLRFRNDTSARRLTKFGVAASGWVYVKNFLSQVFLKKSVTDSHVDVR